MDADEARQCEAELAAAIFSLENLRELCHEYADKMLNELVDKGKLAISATVVIQPEGGTSQVGMSMTLQFMPIAGGMPVVETMLPGKGGVVH